MDISNTTDRQGQDKAADAPSRRQRASQDYTRQVSADDAVRHEKRATKNRDAARRQARSAFHESVEYDRAIERQNMQAGVEKMVRSVVRKESTQEARSDQARAQRSQQADAQAHAQYVREKINSAYNSSVTEPTQDTTDHPNPSNHQQNRAIENYQDSTRNRIDQTVELVI